jgi:hypothetical protein
MEGLHPPHIRKKISKQKSSNIQPQHPHVFLHIKIDHLQSKSRHFLASNNMIHQNKTILKKKMNQMCFILNLKTL